MNFRIVFLLSVVFAHTSLQSSDLLKTEGLVEVRNISETSDDISLEENSISKTRLLLQSIGYALIGVIVGSLASKKLRYSLKLMWILRQNKDHSNRKEFSSYSKEDAQKLTWEQSYNAAIRINLNDSHIFRNMTIGGLVGLFASFLHYRYQIKKDSEEELQTTQ